MMDRLGKSGELEGYYLWPKVFGILFVEHSGSLLLILARGASPGARTLQRAALRKVEAAPTLSDRKLKDLHGVQF